MSEAWANVPLAIPGQEDVPEWAKVSAVEPEPVPETLREPQDFGIGQPFQAPQPESAVAATTDVRLDIPSIGEVHDKLASVIQPTSIPAQPEPPKTKVQEVLDMDTDAAQQADDMGLGEEPPDDPVEARKMLMPTEDDDPQTRLEKSWTSFKLGLNSLRDMAGGAALWAGYEAGGNALREEARKFSQTNQVPELLKEFELSDLADPSFYYTKGVAIIPAMLALAPSAIAGAYGGAALATAAGAGAVGTTIAGTVAAVMASRPLESAMEAASTYNSLVDQGHSPEVAGEGAAEVYAKNLSLAGMDAAQFALAFAKVPPAMRGPLASFIRRKGVRAAGFAAGAASEGFEEVVQGFFQEQAEASANGQADPELLKSLALTSAENRELFALGTLGGGLFQGAGTVVNAARGKLAKEEVNQIIDEQLELNGIEEEEEVSRETIEEEPEVPVIEPEAAPEAVVEPVEVEPTPEVVEEEITPVEPAEAQIDIFEEKAEVKPVEDVVAEEKPVEEAKEDFVGLNVEENESIRAAIGKESLDPVERKTWAQTIENAKSAKLDEDAISTAEEAIRTGRQISDEEHVGMLLKLGGLINEQKAAIKDASEQADKGNVGAAKVARAREDFLIEQIDTLTEGTRLARREAARLLGAGRMRLNLETFDIVAVKQRAAAAKGNKLTAEESQALEERVKVIDEREVELEKLEVAFEKKKLAEAERKAKGIIRVQTRAAKSKKFTGLEAILTERANLKSQIGELGLRVNDVTGLTTEGSFLIGKLAVNYIREGALTLPDVIKKVRSDIPELTDQDVIHAINTKDPRRKVKAKSDTQKRIENLKLQAKLIEKVEAAEKGVFDKPKNRQPKGADIRMLQKRLRELRAQAFQSGVPQAKLERAINTINELQDQLDNHFRAIRKKQPIPEGQLADAKEKIALLRKEMRVEDELLNLQEQLRTGDFVLKERPKPIEVPENIARAQVDLKRARKDIKNAIEAMEPLTGKRIAEETINTARVMKATLDLSYFLRQGGMAVVTDPSLAGKAFKKSLKAAISDVDGQQIDNAIRTAPEFFLEEKSGLEFTEYDGTPTDREETANATMIEKIPGYGALVKGSNRNMTTGLNLLRKGKFDAFLHDFPNATDEELKAWADYVNVTTGRGKLGREAAVKTFLDLVFFSVRFAKSRFQALGAIHKNRKLPRVRKRIAGELVKIAGFASSVLGLAVLFGAEVGTDLRDSDFGKIVIDKTRIDPFFGLLQPIRLILRMGLGLGDAAGFTGKHLSNRENESDLLETIQRFIGFKLSPAVTLTNELLTGRTAVGEPRTRAQTLKNAVKPIVLEDIQEALKLEGKKRAALIAPWVILGGGAATFTRSRSSMVRRLRKMRVEAAKLEEEGKSVEAKALEEDRKAQQKAWNNDPENEGKRKIRSVKFKTKSEDNAKAKK